MKRKYCDVCGSCYRELCCEKVKEPVFCSKCAYFYNGTKSFCDGKTFRDLKCKSPQNLKEVLTFEKRTFEPIGRPKELNKNNDCEWFKEKYRGGVMVTMRNC